MIIYKMNHNMYALEYIKNPHLNVDYLKLEQYIKNYIQVEMIFIKKIVTVSLQICYYGEM